MDVESSVGPLLCVWPMFECILLAQHENGVSACVDSVEFPLLDPFVVFAAPARRVSVVNVAEDWPQIFNISLGSRPRRESGGSARCKNADCEEKRSDSARGIQCAGFTLFASRVVVSVPVCRWRVERADWW